ncbi:hypothetical protein EMIHUDRAFT_112628 [Emiliania huxleyi CCMP1516]|uniref:EGF-like domain-containing protein n=2 Tax=Emiliania huxleyi TaxID=2903 RepID=A0A0D3K7T0_EMIH1|nr:hypothetical protein EMIHUDRAFT_112628 [Emiliania huxleyi CCMP1516]EOD31815.1 hypothetical protein EMIHUDRAFT_112628 [Emiliania huxleyi CCMP1516]|eukprot:XP_005784244.1 hypothetical protein EMIHUDRAFT_112628 [Emiliania huxleyi CCMP1516]
MPAACSTAADCAGFNGDCVSGGCECHPGWAGERCGQVSWSAAGARRAFRSRSWTWGGSPIRDGSTVHMFASEMTGDCGVLHYCSNSRVVHLTAAHPLGPYERAGVALAPRSPPHWDSGGVHGPTIHRVRSGGAWLWALYYMGSANTWDPRDGTHPNCTRRVDPRTGDRATRRVGLATSASLWGPWARRDSPLLGPGDRAAGDWDYEDVSNATPLLLRNGTVLMLYKGRGGDLQAVGVARCARFDGPCSRLRPASPVLSSRVEDTWGWVAPASEDGTRPEVLHVLSHAGNGATEAGGHAWSLDGVRWNDTTRSAGAAYTGAVRWAGGGTQVMLRRERPQGLLRAAAPVRGAGEEAGGSYGVPEAVCTAVQPRRCPADGGPPSGTEDCRSFTICEAVALGSPV